VLSLVVGYSLDTQLECPRCARLFVQSSIAISRDGGECPYCRQTFELWDLPRPKSITERVDSIDISSRSLHLAGLVMAACSAPVWEIAHAGRAASQVANFPDYPSSHEYAFDVAMAAIALIVGIAGAAAFWLWGRHTISTQKGMGTVSRGIGGAASQKHFPLANLNAVRLEKSLNERDEEIHVIRLEGVGFYLDFGETLTEAQRIWVAIWLARKAAALRRAVIA
jgi:hypothetical protein